MKKASIIAAIVIVIALGIFLLTGSKEENPEEAYQFVKVERGDVEALVSSTGTLNAVTTVQVGTQVSGRIAKIFTDFNQRVKQGQVIAQLDTSTLLMAVDSAQSNYAKAMAQLQQAVTDLHRTELLFQEKIRTKNDLEQAQINHTTAKANLQAAKSELERSRINLSYATIYAPIDGVVISRDIDVGQTVAASFTAPPCSQIANDLSKMQILASVDESDIGQIKEGQGARFTVQAYPERNFPGRVSQIRMQPTTTQNVVNYTVVVEVDNPGMLLPGMTATVQFITGQARNVLKVANAALKVQPNNEMADDLKKMMEERRAKMGMRQPGERFSGTANGNGLHAGPPRGANGNGPMAGGHGRSRDIAFLWVVDPRTEKPRPIFVRTGITDGQVTEIRLNADNSEIKEGLSVIRTLPSSMQPSEHGPGGGRPPMRMF